MSDAANAPRSWDDATEMEKLQAEVQSLREGLNHLKDCVQDALKYGYTFPKSDSAAPAWAILDEEWPK